MTRRTRSRILGLALSAMALAVLTVLALGQEIKDGKYALVFYPYAADALTKAEVKSRFSDITVPRTLTQILSKVFRLNTIKGDRQEGTARNPEGSITDLRQLNICPA